MPETQKKLLDVKSASSKKKWKKSSIRKVIGIIVLISVVAVFAGVPFSVVFWTDCVLLIVGEIYGRIAKRFIISNNNIMAGYHSPYTSEYDWQWCFSSSKLLDKE